MRILASHKSLCSRIVSFVGLLALMIFPLSARGEGATRDLPDRFTPDVSFRVVISIVPPAGTLAVAVEDEPPGGWVVSSISHDGVFDAFHGKVKWGPFFEGSDPQIPAEVTYDLTPPGDAAGEHCFLGATSFDGFNQSVVGDECVSDCDFTGPLACFRLSEVKIEDDRRGGIKVKGTFDLGPPFDPLADIVTFIVSDATGQFDDFVTGPFKVKGDPAKQEFEFKSPSGERPEIKAKLKLRKCEFELEVKRVDTSVVRGPVITVSLHTCASFGVETVRGKRKGVKLEFKKKVQKCCR